MANFNWSNFLFSEGHYPSSHSSKINTSLPLQGQKFKRMAELYMSAYHSIPCSLDKCHHSGDADHEGAQRDAVLGSCP